MTAAVRATHKAWIDETDQRLDDFRAQVLRIADPADYPLASDVRSNVLVYSPTTVNAADRRALQSELIRALANGPGVVVFEGAFDADVTHLKDIGARASRGGMYTPLGGGDVDIAGVVTALYSNGFDGWFVMEQETILEGEPIDEGPGRRAAARHRRCSG
jgi:predicted extracellular nuclease